MSSFWYFYILVFVSLISSSQGQAQDSCITCVIADYAKSSLGAWFDEVFFPAAGGALQLFQVDPEPQPEPVEQKKTDLPGQFDQPGADVEIGVTADPYDNEKCKNPNSAGVSGLPCPYLTILTTSLTETSIPVNALRNSLRRCHSSDNLALAFRMWRPGPHPKNI